MIYLTLIHEGVAWLDEDALTVGVELVAQDLAPPAHWRHTTKPQETYDYVEDHRLGRELLFREFERLRASNTRVLEIGGCCNPMARGLAAEVFSVDIDIQTLQVGHLSITDPAERLHFIAADVNDLPFVDQSFDAVVMFASLHHFARPVEVLRRLRRLLKNVGFLAIMCEPVGEYLNGNVSAEFRAELEQGINEQIFTLEEYHHMFLRAGLYSPSVEADRGSLKAILRPAGNRPAQFSLSNIWNGIRRSWPRSA